VNAADNARIQKVVSVRTASHLLEVFWPDFVEMDGCIFAKFQCNGGPVKLLSEGRTETECFINHTHIFDEFRNRATFALTEPVSEELDVVEETYDAAHPDFVAACEVGRRMAQIWAIKLKADFPDKRFRVYYTQYDNPIVRFHMVRSDEPVWLTDGQLNSATEPSFGNALIFDTNYLDKPVEKKAILPN
jgi:hypothetical protein